MTGGLFAQTNVKLNKLRIKYVLLNHRAVSSQSDNNQYLSSVHISKQSKHNTSEKSILLSVDMVV